MILEFNLYKVNEESSIFKLVSKFDTTNEFIAVGEEIINGEEYLKLHQLTENGLKLIGGLKLDELAFSVRKSEVSRIGDGIGFDYTELDIPKEYLTMDLIETIQRING